MMDSNSNPKTSEPQKPQNPPHHSSGSGDYVHYPNLEPEDITPPPPPPYTAPAPAPAPGSWTSVPVGSGPESGSAPAPFTAPTASEAPVAPISGTPATSMPAESNPYISPAPARGSSVKNTMDSVKDVLGKWGKKAADATKKGQDLAGNMWQHLKTGPSMADTAVGRIAQGTKILAEGGYEKVFKQSFETTPEEKLLKYYACYLSTSAGPVMGVLYLSNVKLAFSSDSPLSYQVGEETQWSYYKVVIPLYQLKAVNTSMSKTNAAEKYIQIISVDNHEFWFMGFVYYDSAVKNLKGILQAPPPQQ